MQFDIITIFPQIFDSYFNESIIGRAQKNKKIKIKVHNLRDYTTDKHKSVDDKPYGGGVGMLMKVEPIYKALKSVRRDVPLARLKRPKSKVILLSAKGKKFNQAMAKKFSKLDQIVFVCGRYEGVDERVLKFVDEEVSVGDYVLTGGEIPTMTIVDAVSRLVPGVLGKDESANDESHSVEGCLEYPQYTRPFEFEYKDVKSGKFKKLKVPKVLLSGNHKEIEEWKKGKVKKIG